MATRRVEPSPVDGLRRVVADVGDGLVVVDRSRRVRFANPAACALLARPLMSLLGSRLDLPVAALGTADLEVSVAGLARTVEVLTSQSRWDGGDATVVSLRDVTERARALVEAQDAAHQALYDPLTGLPARALLVDRINQALARAARTAGVLGVLFVDLDDFKPVNDRFGHDAGDRVLRMIAGRMAAAVRPADTVCRLGGDEFVVVCEGLSGTGEARELAERVRAAVGLPTRADGHEVALTASVGVATAGPGASAEQLVRDADAAMLLAKKDGKAAARLFDQDSRDLLSERIRLESGLQSALEDGRIGLAYQPVVDLSTGAVVGCEALLRYDDPDHGVCSADAFIGLAEAAGVAVPLGNWAIEQACRDAARWQEAGWPLPVTVNVGAPHLAGATLARSVSTALEKARIAPESLCIDITEDAAVGVTGPALSAVLKLADHGVRIGIDNWGAGLAPVATLTRLPLSYVKLHRSVVARLGTDRRTADALLAAVRALGLRASAVGVESTQQLRLALALGCVDGQGYHLGAPMSSDELLRHLADRRRAGGCSGARPGPADGGPG